MDGRGPRRRDQAPDRRSLRQQTALASRFYNCRPGAWRIPPSPPRAGSRFLLWWQALAVVRVPAVWPDAVHRPCMELAAFMHQVADRAGDGELREILRPLRLTHATR